MMNLEELERLLIEAQKCNDEGNRAGVRVAVAAAKLMVQADMIAARQASQSAAPIWNNLRSGQQMYEAPIGAQYLVPANTYESYSRLRTYLRREDLTIITVSAITALIGDRPVVIDHAVVLTPEQTRWIDVNIHEKH